ncbi:MAG TPA: BlaI/MecI/CopY family transcriptional regulator [Thermoanaerobaculia bacterium]|nr:BlaI/MecI/CopY family transcriptional regulator [Thermoanaerobaculia bacterium]
MTPIVRKPTPAELTILSVLWERGPSTVRQIHESFDDSTGYTTILKTLQIMSAKGLVRRDESQRAHVYHALHPQEEIQSHLVVNLLDGAFGGSAAKLVMQALSTRPASSAELDEIRGLLENLQERADVG